MFCEAVKVALITVLFEDLIEAITLHKEFSGEKVRLEPSTSLLNKIDTFDGYVFNIDVFTDEVNALQKELLVLFEGFCIFWLQGSLQKFALYFDGSEHDHT